MNKEEILAMEAGSTLDALIAEDVMKWYISEGEYSGKQYWNDENDYSPYSVKGFKPSTDISAAWEVVEKMKKSNWWIVLSSEGETWNALFYWDPDQMAIEAISESAPEAICKAALLAVTDS